MNASIADSVGRNARGMDGAGVEDFRDHIPTADSRGKRVWIYPKAPRGRFTRYRTLVSWVLLAVMFAGPFVRIHGNPLLLFNIVERRFSILGQTFWPQDGIIFAVAMLLFLTGIIVFTTAFGRLWCGWTCPQTLLMEMVFRPVEYWIEGDASAQKRLAAAPWSLHKLAKKGLKQGVFFVMSFVIANVLLSYIIGTEQLFEIITDDPRLHLTGLGFMMLFTLMFYLIFARFREQACTFICPYGRFQSTMLDENTMVVAYDYKRGESRGRWRRAQSEAERRSAGVGDCIACRQCVAVCPTGIDIRDGTQMECVHCTACIDACDGVMEKIGLPHGLIRYASADSIETGERFKFTPRMAMNTAVLAALGLLLGFLIFTRSDVEAMVLRAPGALHQVTAQGRISNLYILKVINKSSRDIPVELRLEERAGELKLMGAVPFLVPKQELAQTSVLIALDPEQVAGSSTPLKIGVYSDGRLIETVKTTFSGPRPLKK